MESFLREGLDLQGLAGRTLAGDAHFFEDSTPPSRVHQYLDSIKEDEKLNGMKWLLAMVSKGKVVSEFFPGVVKNVGVKSIEVKKMDMSCTNPLIRGLALRVLTSIRVPDVIQIQLLAAQKCSSDSSPYVRKCAATSLTKIYLLDRDQLSHLKQILEKLLNDTSTMVLGSAMATFNEICPTSYEIIHRSYRKLCHLLADMDEWSQISALDVMARYVRSQFTDPSPGVSAAIRLQAKQRSNAAVIGNTVKRRVTRRAFYSDEEDEVYDEEIEVESQQQRHAESGSVFATTKGAATDVDGNMDLDHRLVLRSSQPLLKSRNTGVVLAVCSLHYCCGSHSTSVSQQIGKALVRILRNPREIQYVVLSTINTMARERPHIFKQYLSDFFVKSSDPLFNRLLKLEILTSLCTRENVHVILRELQTYIRHTNSSFVCGAIRAVARAADADTAIAGGCMQGLLQLLLSNKDWTVVEQSVIALRQLIQQNHQSQCDICTKVLRQLAKLLLTQELNVIPESMARCSVVWLIGEYHSMIAGAAPDILRLLSVGFRTECTYTKTQIMNLAIKLALHLPDDDKVQALMMYVLELARYDVDTDLRDRSRFLTALMGLAPSPEGNETSGNDAAVNHVVDEDALGELAGLAASIMLSPKLPPVTLLDSVDSNSVPHFNLGSLSSLVGYQAPGYKPLPAWRLQQPDATVRDPLKRGAASSDDEEGHGRRTGAGRVSSGRDDSRRGGREDEALAGFYGEGRARDSSGGSSDENESDESEDEEEGDSEGEEDDESDGSSYDTESSSDMEELLQARNAPSQLMQAVHQPMPPQPQTYGGLVRQAATANSKRMGSSEPVFLQSADPLVGSKGTSLTSNNMDDLSALFSSSSVQEHNVAAITVHASAQQSSSYEVQPPLPHLPQSLINFGDTPTSSTSPLVVHPGVPDTHPDLSGIGMLSQKSPILFVPPQQQQYLALVSSGSGSPQPPQPFRRVLSASPKDERVSMLKTVLRPDLSRGLSVSLVYRFEASPTSFVSAYPVYIVVKNCSDFPIRRIKISCPPELRHTQIEDIHALLPGQEIWQPMEIAFNGHAGKTFRMDIRSDVGAFTGSLQPQEWELLTPLPMQTSEFEACRRRLTGFNYISRDFALSALQLVQGPTLEHGLLRCVLKHVNGYVVQGPGVGELMIAAILRKGIADEKVLMTVYTHTDKVTLAFNCDEALMATTLSDLFRRSLPLESTC